jgi:hypothetical protein
MLDISNIPSSTNYTQIFYGISGSNAWQTWVKPRGAKFIQRFCLGGGGGGCGGSSTNSGVNCGGSAGGGGSSYTNGLFPAASVLYKDPALLNYKDSFFNNAPVGKIYSTGVAKVKPIFEGKLQRAIDQAIGAGLGRVAAKKETAKQSWAKVLADIKKVITN